MQKYVSIYGEHQCTVSSFTLLISFYTKESEGKKSCNVPDHVRLEIDGNSNLVLLDSETKAKICSVKFQSIELKPSKCHSLQWQHAGGIQFIVKTNKNDISLLKVDHKRKMTFKRCVMEKLSDTKTRVNCYWCDKEIFNTKQKFGRVCDLPSEDWAELADMWFCHPEEPQEHGKHSKKSQHKHKAPDKHPLLPKKKDCFVGSSVLWLHPEYLETFGSTVEDEDTKEIQCKNCEQTIGNTLHIDQTSGEFVMQLDYTAIRIQDRIQNEIPKTISDSFHNLEYLFSSLLMDYLDKQTFRLLITARTLLDKKLKPMMQIWIIGDETNIYSTEIPMKAGESTKNTPPASPKTATPQVAVPQGGDGPQRSAKNRRRRNKRNRRNSKNQRSNSSCSSDSAGDDSTTTTTTEGAGGDDTEAPAGGEEGTDAAGEVLEPCPMLKVFYVDCLTDTDKDWFKDSTEEIVTLSEQSCLQLLAILIKSTQSIPCSLRKNRQFYIGQLKRLQRVFLPEGKSLMKWES